MVYKKKKRVLKNLKILLLVLSVLSGLFLCDYWRIKKGYSSYLKRWLPRFDYTFQAHQIDMALEAGLVKLGLSTDSIIRSYREEKKRGRKKWIEVYKELKVPLETDLNYYAEVMENSVSEAGGRIISKEVAPEKGQIKLIFGIKNIPVATLIFKALPRAKIAIVIDDIGYGGKTTEKLLRLPFPATLSILPNLAHSRDIAEKAHRQGYEVLLHLPMESIKASENRGPGIIYADMDKKEIIDLIEKHLESVPYVVGVNNHMGSRVCQKPEVMEIILGQIKKHKLYFIDSLVIVNSQAYDIAQKMSIPSNYRSVFLDNQNDPDYIKGQLEELKEKAISEGEAIGIGHCRINTLEVLTEVVPEMEKEGIKFVFASELVK